MPGLAWNRLISEPIPILFPVNSPVIHGQQNDKDKQTNSSSNKTNFRQGYAFFQNWFLPSCFLHAFLVLGMKVERNRYMRNCGVFVIGWLLNMFRMTGLRRMWKIRLKSKLGPDHEVWGSWLLSQRRLEIIENLMLEWY